ncbi:MAG: bifunctional molybdenum cofactor biosynthesis protein MoaC/MoaB [Bacteroidia bacterium]|jgi:cyclic pyranopterin phosphate synthase|nr:bifunctional molybdenum cofactor biosynthesis protein MoaC/MoaB [Bacteroidia bacterium]
MIDITYKSNTYRRAIASATVVVGSNQTMDALINKRVPKGDVLEMARTAGLFGVKRTSELIPDCHPLPIEQTAITYELEGLEIRIFVEVSTIYKTGVEVEAMHGASVVALTIYDMLKPIDKQIEIKQIKLIEKKGGKSDFKNNIGDRLKAAVIVCSDSISAGTKEDKAGKAIMAKLEAMSFANTQYMVIPDNVNEIQNKVKSHCTNGIDLLIITGGTGLSPTDVTPEALQPLIEREVPGIAEAIRNYGQQRMPYSMLSRSVCGLIGNTVVLALPGSTRGAEESMDAVFPALLHIFKMMKGGGH